MIGRTLGHYRIAGLLGKGGMGEVYLAEDAKLNRRVALKVLPPELAGVPERRRRFEREAQAVAALNHPNIVMVHSVEEAEGVHFITMELVEGRTLSELIPKDGLPLGRFFELAVPLVDAVSAAHGRGVTHRDLKPENVMVTDEGRVKVLDFGLAKLTEGAPSGEAPSEGPPTTEPGRVFGTVPYMSPEQAEGKPVDHRTDIFSLGVVLYVMATGRRPFEGETPVSILSAVLKDTPLALTERKPTLPRELGRIVRLCLHKDPERRYQTAKDIHNELEDLKEELDSGAPPLMVAERPPRRRVTSASAVGLGALALGISIYAVFFRRESAESAWEIKPLTSSVGYEYGGSWSPDGDFFVYVQSQSGNADIFVMPAAGGQAVPLVQDPADDFCPAWSPDSRWVAFASNRGGRTAIYLVPPLGGPVRKLAETGFPYLFPAFVSRSLAPTPWYPDGRRLVYSRASTDGSFALWNIDIHTGDGAQLSQPGPGEADVSGALSFDGARIVFSRVAGGRGSLWVMPTAGGEPRPLLHDDHDNLFPSWSFDGRRVLFTSDRTGARNLWEIEVGTGELRQLTRGPGQDIFAASARDGRIAFVTFNHQTDLYATSVDGAHDERLTFHTTDNYYSRISPDGRKILYMSTRTGNAEVWVLERSTGLERCLTDHPAWDTYPDWSSDGERIVFVSDRGGPPQLWTIGADGGDLRRLSEQPVRVGPSKGQGFMVAGAPRWSPDGRLIGYVAPAEGGDALWVLDIESGTSRTVRSGVEQFDWYRDSRHVVYVPPPGDASGSRELRALDLERGEEIVLLREPIAEMVAAPDGSAVSFCTAQSHFSMELFTLFLAPPQTPGGLPRAVGEPRRITDGRGRFHVHNGGFSPDGKELVHTRDVDTGDVYVIEPRR